MSALWLVALVVFLLWLRQPLVVILLGVAAFVRSPLSVSWLPSATRTSSDAASRPGSSAST